MIDKDDVAKARADQRLPMQDHNTRVIVFGGAVAELIQGLQP